MVLLFFTADDIIKMSKNTSTKDKNPRTSVIMIFYFLHIFIMSGGPIAENVFFLSCRIRVGKF